MDLPTLLLLLFVYGVLNFLFRSRRPEPPQTGGETPLPAPRRPARVRPQVVRPVQKSSLENFLRQFEDRLAEASGEPVSRGPLGRRASRPLESSEEIEEVQSLERDPEVHSLEVEPDRRERVEIDLDEEAIAAAARRRRLVDEDSRPLTVAGHRDFDKKVRTEVVLPNDPAAAARLKRLRQAVILREVLGPPRSLEDR
ncbi:MAG: hypothetical protein ACRENB_09705 [Gemmatimonadales bacterium]